MEVRFEGPLPFRLHMNRWMISGVIVFVLGAALWVVDVMIRPPADSVARPLLADPVEITTGPGNPMVLHKIAWGTVLAGISLYFFGRVVQLIAVFKTKRSPEPPHDA